MILQNSVLLSHLNLDGDEVNRLALDRAFATAVAAVQDYTGIESIDDALCDWDEETETCPGVSCAGGVCSLIPAPVIRAILELTAHYYEHRDPIITGDKPYSLPINVFELVGPYRDWTF